MGARSAGRDGGHQQMTGAGRARGAQRMWAGARGAIADHRSAMRDAHLSLFLGTAGSTERVDSSESLESRALACEPRAQRAGKPFPPKSVRAREGASD